MELRRRGFLKAITSGLAFGCAGSPMAFALTAAGASSGELETSSGTLHLRGRLKSGVLTLNAHDFIDLSDRSVTVRGRLGSVELYSAMFSYQKDLNIAEYSS